MEITLYSNQTATIDKNDFLKLVKKVPPFELLERFENGVQYKFECLEMYPTVVFDVFENGKKNEMQFLYESVTYVKHEKKKYTLSNNRLSLTFVYSRNPDEINGEYTYTK